MNKLKKKFDLENFVNGLSLNELSLDVFQKDYKGYTIKKQVFEALNTAMQTLLRNLNSAILKGKNYEVFSSMDGINEVFIFLYHSKIYDDIEKKALTKKLQENFLYNVRNILIYESETFKRAMLRVISHIKSTCWNPYLSNELFDELFNENNIKEQSLEKVEWINKFGSIEIYELFIHLIKQYQNVNKVTKFSQIFRYLEVKYDFRLKHAEYKNFIEKEYNISMSKIFKKNDKEYRKLEHFDKEFQNSNEIGKMK